ncbi:hypothetical protein GOP47_0023279 [Adiantum capillus-veneris]|uniref:COG complex component COG2 C-terminal domain-containing protein n=1 Tax=Adiantum capillus-veneris TaxID=13818 RepID=A0A9D4Z6D1_ADICA|nr:hypothetical protein GOP47_0023279 [Adiantum capillus-veneris]
MAVADQTMSDMHSSHSMPLLQALRAALDNHLQRVLLVNLADQLDKDYPLFLDVVNGIQLQLLAKNDHANTSASINGLRCMVSCAKESLVTCLSGIQANLHLQAEVTHTQKFLELLLHITGLVSKIDSLLLQDQKLQINDMHLESRSILLVRIVTHLEDLNVSLVRVDSDFSPNHHRPLLLMNLEPTIQSFHKCVDAILHDCFKLALQQQHEASILRCLQSYLALDNVVGARDAIRLSVVAPIMDQVFYHNATKNVLLHDDLKEVKMLINASICKFLLDITSSKLAWDGAACFDFLGACILQELQSAIQRTRALALSPGEPSSFLANYKQILEFLDFMEAHYCPSRKSILHFRSQAEYTHFLNPWKAREIGYFTLRHQEIVGELEHALMGEPILNNKHLSLAKPSLAASKALEQCLLKCWDIDMFVTSLSHKFLALTLQLISRYSTWLASALSSHSRQNNFMYHVEHDVTLLVDMLKGPFLNMILRLLQSSSTSITDEVISLIHDSIYDGAKTMMESLLVVKT